MPVEDAIFDLFSPYLGLGYCVFMAEYYNSFRLIQDHTNKKRQFVEQLLQPIRELLEQQILLH